MRKDIHNAIKTSRAIAPAAAAQVDNTAIVSAILDTANFDANELVLVTGNLADADVTCTVLLEEGDNSALSDASAVADADLLGTEAGAQVTFTNDNVTAKLGYKGSKRYIRATVTPVNNTGAFALAAAWVQSGCRSIPQSTQIN